LYLVATTKIGIKFIPPKFIINLFRVYTNLAPLLVQIIRSIKYRTYHGISIMRVPQKLSMAAMAAIVLAAIAAGNNGGNSGGGGSSGNGGGCDDEDIGGYSNGGAHRQQSTKSGRGRNGEDNDDNGRGWQ
jgi:hypothetical protein